MTYWVENDSPDVEPSRPQVLEELVEVHSGGAQDDVVHIPLCTPETIAVEPVFFLEVPYAGLDRCTALHPFP